MANHVTVLISFMFDYDGSSSTIVVNTQKGPVFFATQFGLPGIFSPLYNSTATGVENTTVSDNVHPPASATATMGSGGVLTVDIPSGLTAGACYCQATLVY